jgi:hypothetical protein
MMRGFSCSLGLFLVVVTTVSISANARAGDCKGKFRGTLSNWSSSEVAKCYTKWIQCDSELGRTENAARWKSRIDAVHKNAKHASDRGTAIPDCDDRMDDWTRGLRDPALKECRSGLPKCEATLDDKRKTEATNRALQQGKATEEKAKHVEDLAKTGGTKGGATVSTGHMRSGIHLWRRDANAVLREGRTLL